MSVQCNLDLVTLLVSAKIVTKSHDVTKLNDFMYLVNGKRVFVKSKHYRRLLVLWKGTCAPKAQKPVTLP